MCAINSKKKKLRLSSKISYPCNKKRSMHDSYEWKSGSKQDPEICGNGKQNVRKGQKGHYTLILRKSTHCIYLYHSPAKSNTQPTLARICICVSFGF